MRKIFDRRGTFEKKKKKKKFIGRIKGCEGPEYINMRDYFSNMRGNGEIQKGFALIPLVVIDVFLLLMDRLKINSISYIFISTNSNRFV